MGGFTLGTFFFEQNVCDGKRHVFFGNPSSFVTHQLDRVKQPCSVRPPCLREHGYRERRLRVCLGKRLTVFWIVQVSVCGELPGVREGGKPVTAL